ncbi:uncharacterized mitochondrial protein AtMg00810-like [Nicotiana tomentosiformis]|uniref:uncharacterized mitochondrial protein AtMg00810-like n=1 Tax=Nicotiana tomentosiformis TaxID=4098 RepID=UPI000879165D
MVTVRTIISVAASKNWFLYQMDVNNAFLQGYLYEEVYMDLPQGFHRQGEYKDTARVLMIILCSLNREKGVKDLGELKYFLGIEVLRSKQGILLNQRKYALELIFDVGLSATKPATTTLEANTRLTTVEFNKLTDDTVDPLLEYICSYQKMFGKLIYLTITRPDICFTVQVLSQFMQQPKRSHWETILRMVRYIKRSPGLGVFLSQTSATQLTAYCGSDWAACPNTRRSVIGYVIKLGDSLISWKSKK